MALLCAPLIWSQSGAAAEVVWSGPAAAAGGSEVHLYGRGLPAAAGASGFTIRNAEGLALPLSAVRGNGTKLTLALPADLAPGEYEVAGQSVRVEKASPAAAREVAAGAYGAFPNDDGDDTAALQKAIDAAAEGDSVTLDAGEYRVAHALYLRHGVAVRGAGETRLALAGPEGMLVVEAAGVSLSGMTVRAAGGEGAGRAALVLASGAVGFRVELCAFDTSAEPETPAIRLIASLDTRIAANAFVGGAAIAAEGVQGLTAERNHFTAAGATVLRIDGGLRIDISRNVAELEGAAGFLDARTETPEHLYVGENDIVQKECGERCPDPVDGESALTAENRRYNDENAQPKTGTRSAAGEINIADYGACSAYDAASAVQNAINALPSSGAVLNVSCMANIGAAGIRLADRTNITVRGTNGGGFRSIGKTNGLGAGVGPVMFALVNCDYCVVENLQLNGNRINNATLGLRNSDNTIVRNNAIFDVGVAVGTFEQESPLAGLVAMGNRNNQYVNNRVTNTARWPGTTTDNGIRGMWIGNPWASDYEYDAEVSGNTVINTGYTSIASHVVRGRFRNNTLDNTGYNGGCAGIKTVPPSDQPGETIIENNVSKGHNCAGLAVVNIQPIHSVMVRNNWLENNRLSGMYNDPAPFHNVTITGNTFLNNRDSGYAGIWLHQGNNVIVSNNVFRDSRSGSARTQRHGIAFANNGTFSNFRIECNRFENHLSNGIAMWNNTSYSNLQMSNNTYAGNEYGVFAQAPYSLSGLNVFGNAYSGNSYGATYNIAAGEGTPNCAATTPPGDTTKPVISNIAVSSIGTSSATVTWTTDEDAAGQVEYRASGSSTTQLSAMGGATKSHRIALSGLAAGTTYVYRVTAKDAAGNAGVSPELTFATTANPTNGPTATVTVRAYGSPASGVFPAMQLRQGTQTLASWTVNGTAQNYTFTGALASTTQNLQVHFTNDVVDSTGDRNLTVESLTFNGTTFASNGAAIYSVGSWDPASGCAAGYKRQSDLHCDGYFEYPTAAARDTAAPVLSGGTPSGTLQAGVTQATLTVTTNEAATCRYATAANVAFASMPTAFAATGGTTHSSPLSNLAAGTTFNYYVRCTDASGNANTADYRVTFSTAQAVSNTVVVRAWGTPSGGQFPAMELRMGTALLASWTVTGTAADYTFRTSSPLNTAKLRVHFTNDIANSGGDRNLAVEWLKLNTQTYLTTAQTVYSTGSWAPSNGCAAGFKASIYLHCNGYFEFPTQ